MNLSVSNGNSYEDQEFNPQIEFNETRNVNIVSKASDYELSVIRFSIPTSAIPLLIAPLDLFKEDGSSLSWQICCKVWDSAAGDFISFTRSVQYQTMDLTAPIPSNDNGIQDTSTKYWYIYSQDHICSMINNTFLDLFSDFTGYGIALTGPPFLEWNGDSQKFSLFCPPEWSGVYGGSDPTRGDPSNHFTIGSDYVNQTSIIFNSALFYAISNLPAMRIPLNSGDFNNYTLNIFPNASGSNIVSVPNRAGNWIKVSQEFSCTQNINSFQSIVLTTSQIPLRAEIVSRPPVYGVASAGIPSNADTMQILSDFLPESQVGWEASRSGYLEYLPSAEYRFTDLVSDDPLKTLNLQVWWTDKSGTMRPLNLPPNSQATMKLMLRKKIPNKTQ